jgi:hypothetical protein
VKNFLIFTIFISVSFIVSSQTDSIALTPNYNDSLIVIRGNVVDTSKSVSFYNVMIVNKTAGKGIFGSYDGSFSITVKKSDLVAFSVTGYKTKYLSFKEKNYKDEYSLTIYLDMLSFIAEKVEVKPYKTLQELQEERALIAKREIPQVTGVNVLQSPITALYMQFSKREKTKRLIADMEYDDQKREIVKEILRVYVHNDIIALEDEEFNAFITFLNLNDNFLKTATDYELIVYIKYKFEHFQKINSEGF